MTTKKGRLARKRRLYGEVVEGLHALADERSGRRTLKTHAVAFRKAPKVTPSQLVKLREALNVSQPLLAAYLRTNVRTLENWEQGRAEPNAQASLLIHLVQRYPDTVDRLATL